MVRVGRAVLAFHAALLAIGAGIDLAAFRRVTPYTALALAMLAAAVATFLLLDRLRWLMVAYGLLGVACVGAMAWLGQGTGFPWVTGLTQTGIVGVGALFGVRGTVAWGALSVAVSAAVGALYRDPGATLVLCGLAVFLVAVWGGMQTALARAEGLQKELEEKDRELDTLTVAIRIVADVE